MIFEKLFQKQQYFGNPFGFSLSSTNPSSLNITRSVFSGYDSYFFVTNIGYFTPISFFIISIANSKLGFMGFSPFFKKRFRISKQVGKS